MHNEVSMQAGGIVTSTPFVALHPSAVAARSSPGRKALILSVRGCWDASSVILGFRVGMFLLALAADPYGLQRQRLQPWELSHHC